MNRSRSLVFCIAFILGCQSQSLPPVSDRGREICLQESRLAGTPSQQDRRYSICLNSIEGRLARKAKPLADATPPSNELPEDKPVSASERYTYCVFHKEKIREAYSMQFGLQGPAISLAKKYGREDPRTKKAVATQQEAYRDLENLIPERMRDGEPLIPDSVDIFMRCDRADFFNQ